MKELLVQLAENVKDKSNLDSGQSSSTGQSKVNTVGTENTDLVGSVTGILNAVIGVLSFACVVVIIIGGVTYMTSSGDSSKVKKAKDTILYGVIGLAVCVLAFAIVNFVIGNILNQN